jgi:myo-inositol-1(or 4)-monophosphatase
MPPYDNVLEEARPFLRSIVMEAGKIVMRRFRTPLDPQAKEGNDIVTQADFESESFVADSIRNRFPDHSLTAEEGSRGAPDSDYRWFIDPLDGTVNYAAGVPVFAVAISLAHENEPILAAILDPTRDQLFFAERGAGATMNGTPLQVSRTDRLSDSVVYMSGFGLRRQSLAPSVLGTLERLGPETRNLINLGSAGIAWSYVASGHIDADYAFAVDQFTGPAGVLLVREAGGTVTDFDGAYWKPGASQCLATNGTLHDQFLAMIHRA